MDLNLNGLFNKDDVKDAETPLTWPRSVKANDPETWPKEAPNLESEALRTPPNERTPEQISALDVRRARTILEIDRKKAEDIQDAKRSLYHLMYLGAPLDLVVIHLLRSLQDLTADQGYGRLEEKFSNLYGYIFNTIEPEELELHRIQGHIAHLWRHGLEVDMDKLYYAKRENTAEFRHYKDALEAMAALRRREKELRAIIYQKGKAAADLKGADEYNGTLDAEIIAEDLAEIM